MEDVDPEGYASFAVTADRPGSTSDPSCSATWRGDGSQCAGVLATTWGFPWIVLCPRQTGTAGHPRQK